MGFSTALLGLTLSTTLATGATGGALCTPARLGSHVATQPEAWRQAAVALIESTATPGAPWSCGGGEVDLVATPDGATLTVTTPDGETIIRAISWPDEVQPLGEALLARPLPPPAEAPKVAKPEPPPEVASPRLAPPRVLVSATIAPRYAGGAKLVWGGVAAGVALPFGRWGGGVWLRYDGLVARLDDHAPPMREVCVGASAFRSFAVGPIELRAALRPSLGVVTESDDHGDRDDTRFDFRIGAEMATIIPITKRFRALIALDGEISPRELARKPPPPHTPDRSFPSFTVGLGVGVEVAFR